VLPHLCARQGPPRPFPPRGRRRNDGAVHASAAASLLACCGGSVSGWVVSMRRCLIPRSFNRVRRAVMAACCQPTHATQERLPQCPSCMPICPLLSHSPPRAPQGAFLLSSSSPPQKPMGGGGGRRRRRRLAAAAPRPRCACPNENECVQIDWSVQMNELIHPTGPETLRAHTHRHYTRRPTTHINQP
jgi:hypothetical protein